MEKSDFDAKESNLEIQKNELAEKYEKYFDSVMKKQKKNMMTIIRSIETEEELKFFFSCEGIICDPVAKYPIGNGIPHGAIK
jgi:hypothetical protein